jgi:hypothetical protein
MKKLLFVMVLFGLILVTTSCQKSQEVTVSKYFQAMSHNDKDTMASMAIEPKFIEFKSYKIESVIEPVVEEYQLPILLKTMDQYKKDRRDLAIAAGEKRDHVEDLKDQLNETRGTARKNELKKQIEEAEVVFYKAEQDFKDLVKKMGDLKNAIETERNLVNLSTGIKRNVEVYQGTVEKTPVMVKVTLPDGSQADFVFQLVKYNFSMDEKTIPSRLLILKIQTAEEYQKELKMAEEKPVSTEEVSEEVPAEEKNE